jgi:NADH-quinone oxidoreductase subunit G
LLRTFVNNEGRAQRFYQTFVPQDDIQASWQWIRDIMAAAGKSVLQWRMLDDVTQNMISAIPLFGPVQDIAMPADFTIHGQKIPRQPHRYSGRTAMHANVTVHEPKPPEDPDSPLAFTMEGYDGQPPAPFILRYWRPRWNSVQSLNKFQQEVGGPLQGGDPGKRLIDPGRASHAPYFMNIPGAFTPRANEWLIVPFSQIFGSEELSVLSPGIAARASRSHLVMNPDDAAHLNVQDNDLVTIPMVDTTHRFIIKIDPAIPAGSAGLFARAAVSPGSGEIQPGRIKKGCLICPT